MTDMIRKLYMKGDKPAFIKKLQALGALAKEVGCTQAQLTLAWCLVNKDVSVAIVGASRPEQMVDNLGALDVVRKWTPDLDAKIEAIMHTAPEQPLNWRTWQPLPPRRSVALDIPKA
jgi:aryl-alcohol dehydrogenase-like predicted oxidoreductase